MSDSASPLSTALEQLSLKLLDLTGRNRLINFKHTAGKSLQFAEGLPAAIYKKLVEANNKANISILGLPEPARTDWVELNGRLQRPEPRDHAKSVGVSTEYDISGMGEVSDESNVRALMYPDDLEIEVGDVVRYVDLAHPNDLLTVQITQGKDDFANDVVNENRPLAQALLGAVVGDEVLLHFPGSISKTFQIKEIKSKQRSNH